MRHLATIAALFTMGSLGAPEPPRARDLLPPRPPTPRWPEYDKVPNPTTVAACRKLTKAAAKREARRQKRLAVLAKGGGQ